MGKLNQVWVVEGLDGRGRWYPCGNGVHATKRAAMKEIEGFRANYPYRAPTFRPALYERKEVSGE